MFFSFCPKFAAIIESIPGAVVGGISFVLYGMISAIGVRNVVEAKVDFSKARNTIVAAVILVLALGLSDGISFTVGSTSITLTALAVASIAGIVLNAIFPEKDFDPEKAFAADTESAQINLESDYGKKAKKAE
jgi:uracil permease